MALLKGPCTALSYGSFEVERQSQRKPAEAAGFIVSFLLCLHLPDSHLSEMELKELFDAHVRLSYQQHPPAIASCAVCQDRLSGTRGMFWSCTIAGYPADSVQGSAVVVHTSSILDFASHQHAPEKYLRNIVICCANIPANCHGHSRFLAAQTREVMGLTL